MTTTATDTAVRELRAGYDRLAAAAGQLRSEGVTLPAQLEADLGAIAGHLAVLESAV